MTPPVISFRHVTKTYQIMQRATPRMGAWFLSKAFEYLRREPFRALDDVSFGVAPGEMMALLGSNGAGKSTILKLIAGISQPTSGSVEVHGRVASLLELGVGFHPDLTGMENIFYNGAMMGLSRDQILERLDRIVAFSGLADFLFEPVRHYSSGMYSRLGCSVALHLDPEILLVDEILAVGDAEFQQRGILKILELHERGVTTLLVTHETTTARDICGRMLWIDAGRIRADGPPATVHSEYMSFMMGRVSRRGLLAGAPLTNPPARIDRVALIAGGTETDTLTTGDSAEVQVYIHGEAPARVVLEWRWADGRLLSSEMSEPVEMTGGAATVRYAIPRWPFLKTRIRLTVALADAAGAVLYHKLDNALDITVETPGFQVPDTLVSPQVSWSVS